MTWMHFAIRPYWVHWTLCDLPFALVLRTCTLTRCCGLRSEQDGLKRLRNRDNITQRSMLGAPTAFYPVIGVSQDGIDIGYKNEHLFAATGACDRDRILPARFAKRGLQMEKGVWAGSCGVTSSQLDASPAFFASSFMLIEWMASRFLWAMEGPMSRTFEIVVEIQLKLPVNHGSWELQKCNSLGEADCSAGSHGPMHRRFGANFQCRIHFRRHNLVKIPALHPNLDVYAFGSTQRLFTTEAPPAADHGRC